MSSRDFFSLRSRNANVHIIQRINDFFFLKEKSPSHQKWMTVVCVFVCVCVCVHVCERNSEMETPSLDDLSQELDQT